MYLNIILVIIIYITGRNEAEDVHIPLCAQWNSSGRVIAGSTIGKNGTNNAALNKPTAVVAVGKNNTLYVIDSGNNRLMRYENGSPTGEQVIIYTNTTNGTLYNPQDLAIDEAGGIYISEAGANRVVKWNFNSSEIEVVMKINSPGRIYLNESTDSLYVVEDKGKNADIIRYDLKSSASRKLFSISSNSYAPTGIHVDRHRYVYVTESAKSQIIRWLPVNESIQQVAKKVNSATGSSSMSYPSSVIVDDTDTIYVADMYNNRILRLEKGDTTSSCFLDCPRKGSKNITTNQVTLPYAITFDSKLNFLVVERDMHRIQRFDLYFEHQCMLLYCRPPILSINDHSAIHTRSQPMTLNITAKLDCYIWLNTDIQCKVIACFPGDLTCIESIQFNALVNAFTVPDSLNLLIPPFGLPVGTYNFSCTVTMTDTGLNSTINTTLQIIRSSTIITLLPLGVTKIILGYQQQYTFHPNISSDDIDQKTMRVVYYCRKYPNFDYTTVDGVRLSMDDDSRDPKNSTCFNLAVLPQSFVYDNDGVRSSLTIMSRSLQIGQIYEFYVELYDSEDLVDRSDVVLVQIQSKDAFFIEVSTVFDTLTLDNDYQLFNPTTQLLLQSSCENSCLNPSIEWTIYTGTMANDSIIHWEEYPHVRNDSNQWFYGVNSSMLTATDKLFSANENISYWQFEAVYTGEDQSGSGSVQLKTNYPPVKGFCSINPKNGNTNQLFTIICENWTDTDGIKDYFLHVISSKSDILMSVAHSIDPVFSVHLPSGDPKANYNLSLIVHVRDMLRARTESAVMQIQVKPDEYFVHETSNFTGDIPLNGNLDQLITSFSTILNQMTYADQTILLNDSQIKISELLISTFESLRTETTIGHDINASITFIRNLNRRSTIREYFLNVYENISIPNTIEQIIILSSTINQLTDTTSEWTQPALTIAAKICYGLSEALYDLSRSVTIEEIILVVNSLAQSTSNVFTGVNGPLQQRGYVFDHDLNKDFTSSSDEIQIDYDENIDYELLDIGIPFCNYTRLKTNQACRQEIIDEDTNSTIDVLHKNLDLYHQKMLASELHMKIDESIFLIAKSLRPHLNILQNLAIKYPALRMIVELIYGKDIEEKFIDLDTRNATIYLPKNLSFFSSPQLAVRTTLLPLAPAGGEANVNLSTALTFSVLDSNDQELEINATNDVPIEMFIPRDINLPIPVFIEQNMTMAIPPRYGTVKFNRQFFIFYIDIKPINPNLTISVHFELQPKENRISYAFIYALNRIPAYNSTDHSLDDSMMFCRDNLIDQMDYYKYYIDNLKTTGFTSLYIGIRELGEKEKCTMNSFPTITDQSYGFSSNFSVRIYTSGCYYLNRQGFWKSDGMKVGEKTNFEYTHCYSNHT